MINLFSGTTANEAWLQAAQSFKAKKLFHSHEGRGGETEEILHAGFSLSNPRQRWVTARRPVINPAFALAEIIWIVRGRDDVPFLEYWNSQYPKFVKNHLVAYGAYGHRIRRFNGLDQFERVYQILSSKPQTRQAVLQIWDSHRDIPYEDGSPQAGDIPCNVMSLLKVRGGKLEWMQIIRSNDLFRGVPYNFVQFTYLQEILAGWLGVELGSFNQISDSLHVYRGDMAAVKNFSIEPEEAVNSDSIVWTRSESEAIFRELENRAEGFISSRYNEADHMNWSTWKEAPESAQNILRILGAEAARKQGWSELSKEIMHSCTNSCFIQIWDVWEKRVASAQIH